MTTILHVEDDEVLAELVEDSFKTFGFRGRYITSPTLEHAHRILDDTVNEPRLDIVLSDMHLPDGTGLDVVCSVRQHPARSHVPIIILSGETSSATVRRAYALGANSYVPKGARGRAISETLRTLFAHWLKDVCLPIGDERAGRTYQALGTAIYVRRRKSEVYLKIAEALGDEEGEFWVDFALREGNLANLLVFLRTQLGGREVSSELLDEVARVQAEELRAIDRIERDPVRDRVDTERYLSDLVENLHADRIARITAQLFPVAPVVMRELCDVAADTLESIAAWIETHAFGRALRDQLPRLRSDASLVRAPEDAREHA